MFAINQLINGFKIIFKPGFRALALGPFALNLLLYILLGWYLLDQFSTALNWATGGLPSWLAFLAPVAWLVFGLGLLIGFGYSFALVATLIASPFNGLLAEKVATQTGKRHFQTPLTATAILAIIRRSLWRELIKLAYFLPRILGVLILMLILGFIPIIGFIASVLAFVWAAWSIAVQFIDYPADNDGIGFRQTIEKMRAQRTESISFGAVVTLLLGIPFVNLFVLPAAVAGGTLLWVEKLDK